MIKIEKKYDQNEKKYDQNEKKKSFLDKKQTNKRKYNFRASGHLGKMYYKVRGKDEG